MNRRCIRLIIAAIAFFEKIRRGDIVFVKVIISCVIYFIYALQIAMFLRAILSWLPSLNETKFSDFLFMLTEPIILPIRNLFRKLNWFQNIPMDISFLFAYILLSIVSTILVNFSAF